MNKNITAVILVIISVGIYFTVTSGMIADANKIKLVNDQYTTALSSASQLVATRDRVLADYNAISAQDRDKLDKMIPSAVDNIRLIIDLNNIALQHGFSLPDVKAVAAAAQSNNAGSIIPHAPATRDGSQAQLAATSFMDPVLDTVTVSFTATADYNQFISFLQDLESNLRVMDIIRLTVAAKDNGAYAFQVKLQTYWLRQ